MEHKEYNICVAQLADSLFRFACKCTGNRHDAHDVVQSCFEVLWQKRASVSADKAKAFLFQVAYRQSVDIYRKQGRICYPDAAPDAGSYDMGGHDLKQQIDRALSRLDEQSRALVLLKDYEGYRYEEIAQITGLSVTQVKVYLHRTRKTLKEYLVSMEHII
jgi:RNA polymerase sigma factor (sigma-70 family)